LALLFCGLVVLHPGGITLDSSSLVACQPLNHPKTLSFPLWTNPNILFLGNIPFSIKGITLFALGCEATHISIIPKIPK
jgi:hypothetical protein